MSSKNLYSLLSSPWLINTQSVHSMLPLLINILEKGEPSTEAKKELLLSFAESPTTIHNTGTIEEGWEANSVVAILPIEGTIMKYSGWCNYGTQDYMQIMEDWKEEKSVAGVLLNFDSGGGSVSGTPEFADYIKNYSKPVVAFTNGMMCSAAYYLAAGANKIITTNYIDVVGSIGTLYRTIDWREKYEKEGAKIIEVYATKSTQKNGALRSALDKENPTPIRILEEIVDPANNRFLDFITDNRTLISPEALSGKEYFTALDCLKNGLIDRIGTLEEAIVSVFEISQANNQLKINNNTMSENKTYPKLASVLGLDEVTAKGGFLFGAKTVSFSEEQLDTLEADLSKNQSLLINQLKEAKTKAENSLIEKTSELAVVQQALATAMSAAKLENTGTLEGNIALLAEKVVEYGAQDGDTLTNVFSTGDKQESTQKESTSIYDSLLN